MQAEQDALHLLLDTNPAIDLALTQAASPDAFALLAQIRDRYLGELARRGLRSPAQIDAYYHQVRLAILERITRDRPAGPGADDARFLAGAIYWNARRRFEAVSAWRQVSGGSEGLYAQSCAALRPLVKGDRIDTLAIGRVLQIENGRWLSRSYDRLHHFGYRFDTY